MAHIDHLTVEIPAAAERSESAADFYADALGLGSLVRVRTSDATADAEPGPFTLSLVLDQPSAVDRLVAAARAAGATELKATKKSLWGYGGVLRAPDGTICSIASSSKKDTGEPSAGPESVVLQLGVADVAASRQFYADHGLEVARSYGRRYVEFATGPVTLSLIKRGVLAKVAGVDPATFGTPRLVIAGGPGAVTDPDGFRWEPA